MASMLDIGYHVHWETHPRLRNSITAPALDATETKIMIVTNFELKSCFHPHYYLFCLFVIKLVSV